MVLLHVRALVISPDENTENHIYLPGLSAINYTWVNCTLKCSILT